MPTIPTIIEFCELYLEIEPTPAQRVILKSAQGEALDHEELDLFQQMTGRSLDPAHPFRVLTVVGGAKGGKTGFIEAPLVLWHARFGDHRPVKGEHVRCALIAQDLEAIRVGYDYILDYATASPFLAQHIVGTPVKRSIQIRNVHNYTTTIQVFAPTRKAPRSYSFAMAVLDECAYYRYLPNAADRDEEVEIAVNRGMKNFLNPLLVKCSTPFAREGILWRDMQQHYGLDTDHDVLVFKAPSSVLWPNVSDERIAQEQRIMDPALFEREFMAEFMDAATAWLTHELVEAAVDYGVTVREPQPGVKYIMAIDPSGGGKCAFAASIGHAEKRGDQRVFVQDWLQTWPKPKSGQIDIKEIMRTITTSAARYGVKQAYSDKYAGNTFVQWFDRDFGFKLVDPIIYRPQSQPVGRPLAAGASSPGSGIYMHKSDTFVECGPLFRTYAMRLLDHEDQTRELRNLEARPQQGGKLSIGKPSSRDATDDAINATCLAATMAMSVPIKRPAGRTPPNQFRGGIGGAGRSILQHISQAY